MKHWHLYPEVVGKTQISAARVEAQLRKAQPKSLTQEDEMSIFILSWVRVSGVNECFIIKSG